MAHCQETLPPLVEMSGQRRVRCHLFTSERGGHP
jgi:hypothetical protein